MPYIHKADRTAIDKLVRPLTRSSVIGGPGDLNYAITRLLLGYLSQARVGSPRYADYNEVMGVLECAKLEMYRRAVAPYEDAKAADNGDVYPARGDVGGYRADAVIVDDISGSSIEG